MKYMCLFFMLAITAKADIFRLPLTSSASADGIINTVSSDISPYKRGMLSALHIYQCPTNPAALAATNTIYRINSVGDVTNTLGTVVIGATATSADMTVSAEIPFAVGDSIRIVGNTTNRPFKASCIFITR